MGFHATYFSFKGRWFAGNRFANLVAIGVVSVICCGGLLFTPISAVAMPGDPDPSFGGSGVVTTGGGDEISAIVIQSDGKLVATGVDNAGGLPNFRVVRYQSDGELDETFGNAGVVTETIDDYQEGVALLLQPDGKLIAAGDAGNLDPCPPAVCFGGARFLLARYNPDGTHDQTFGTAGIVTTKLTDPGLSGSYGGDHAGPMVLQPDGKIVTAGWAFGEFAIVRYNADGSLDGSFGSGGVVTTLIGTFNLAQSIVLLPDGRLVVGGTAHVWENNILKSWVVLVRYNADGSLDATFGNQGIVTLSPEVGIDEMRSMVRQPDGKFVGGGVSGNKYFSLVRFNANGSLDESFGSGGVARGILGARSSINAIALEPDGKIVAAGWAAGGMLLRYGQDGTLDMGFGSGGFAVGGANLFNALVAQPDGKMVAAGGRPSFTLERFFANTCGNGIVQDGELCDDGDLVDGDGCDSNCAMTACGNGIVTAGEQCDDGNNFNNDACKNDCTPNICGDGVIYAGVEQCDDGNSNNNDACKNDCTLNVCGDGVIRNGIEQCDDGNRASGDDCSSSCRFETIRGNGSSPLRDRSGCQLEWFVTDPNRPLDRYGLPKAEQICLDGDPTCDFEASQPGLCAFRVVVCLNTQDLNLPACVPNGIAAVSVLAPQPQRTRNVSLQAVLATDVAALQNALSHLLDPANPDAGYVSAPPLNAGQQHFCSAPFLIDVPLGKSRRKSVTLKTRSTDNRLPALRTDVSRLKLTCKGRPPR